ncbi:SulP family inorganic anion transporter [Methanobrevibacter filiformis]|uniref:Putative sulfate transporterc n=1 Tax=Methanobrevibacter filiformis TaxID=55758 RepID=A0A162FD37_9EURY|nr:SulP family inorganic anion transporter [Methanobrevibacter filiformis]KZX11255.1 putative sulfate transporterc [Methanobrevibacter filiformis]
MKNIENILPLFKLIKSYDKSFLRFDIIAGITLATVTIPEVIAYSSLGNLPPEAGLYASIAAFIAYFIFGSSKQLSIGPTSALSILVGSTIGTLTVINSLNFWMMASFVGILVGVFSILAYIFKMEFIGRIISRTVLTGFSTGAGIYIIFAQLPKLLGIRVTGYRLLENIPYLISHLHLVNYISLSMGIIAIIYLLISEKYFSKLPNTLIIVLIPVIILSIFNLDYLHIPIVGNIPSGLPLLTIPIIPINDLMTIFNLAIACFILAYVETIGATKAISVKSEENVDNNKELLSLGFSNIFSGVIQGFPVGGSLSRSAVNKNAGSKTQLSNLVSAIILIIVILFFSEYFGKIPISILAGVIMIAVLNLIKIKELKEYFEISKKEFIYGLATICGVLFLGMFEGIIIGVAISILGILYTIYNPRIIELGRVKGTRLYKDIKDHDEEKIPEVLILRIGGSPVFLNTNKIKEEILKKVDEKKDIKIIVLDLGEMEDLDLEIAKDIKSLNEILNNKKIELRLAHLHTNVRERIRKMKLDKELNMYPGVYPTIDDIVNNWENKEYDK